MAITIIRQPKPPVVYKHRDISEGTLYGLVLVDRQTGQEMKMTGLFADERDLDDALDVWASWPRSMRTSVRRDQDVEPRLLVTENTEQPVL